MVLIILIRKKGALIAVGATLSVLFALILILFPMIFGAGLRAITMVWAPWSFATGLAIIFIDIVTIAIRFLTVRLNESRTKTG